MTSQAAILPNVWEHNLVISDKLSHFRVSSEILYKLNSRVHDSLFFSLRLGPHGERRSHSSHLASDMQSPALASSGLSLAGCSCAIWLSGKYLQSHWPPIKSSRLPFLAVSPHHNWEVPSSTGLNQFPRPEMEFQRPPCVHSNPGVIIPSS